jgi:phosphatidylserine synthase
VGWVCCLRFCRLRLAIGAFQCAGHGSGGSKYFVGMPTPAAAGVIASMVHAAGKDGPLESVAVGR